MIQMLDTSICLSIRSGLSFKTCIFRRILRISVVRDPALEWFWVRGWLAIFAIRPETPRRLVGRLEAGAGELVWSPLSSVVSIPLGVPVVLHRKLSSQVRALSFLARLTVSPPTPEWAKGLCSVSWKTDAFYTCEH